MKRKYYAGKSCQDEAHPDDMLCVVAFQNKNSRDNWVYSEDGRVALQFNHCEVARAKRSLQFYKIQGKIVKDRDLTACLRWQAKISKIPGAVWLRTPQNF